MSLSIQQIADIPDMTCKIAHKAFPKRNVYMQMRDEHAIWRKFE
jgi:hypothetical protein